MWLFRWYRSKVTSHFWRSLISSFTNLLSAVVVVALTAGKFHFCLILWAIWRFIGRIVEIETFLSICETLAGYTFCIKLGRHLHNMLLSLNWVFLWEFRGSVLVNYFVGCVAWHALFAVAVIGIVAVINHTGCGLVNHTQVKQLAYSKYLNEVMSVLMVDKEFVEKVRAASDDLKAKVMSHECLDSFCCE